MLKGFPPWPVLLPLATLGGQGVIPSGPIGPGPLPCGAPGSRGRRWRRRRVTAEAAEAIIPGLSPSHLRLLTYPLFSLSFIASNIEEVKICISHS
jgi:hypothetical protein